MDKNMNDTDFFMLRSLDLFWKDGTLDRVITECEMDGRDWRAIPVTKYIKYPYISVRVWLAENYRPVSNAMFDKKPIEDVLALWKRTNRVPMAKPKLPRNNSKALIQGVDLGIKNWRDVWRARSDWNTVK